MTSLARKHSVSCFRPALWAAFNDAVVIKDEPDSISFLEDSDDDGSSSDDGDALDGQVEFRQTLQEMNIDPVLAFIPEPASSTRLQEVFVDTVEHAVLDVGAQAGGNDFVGVVSGSQPVSATPAISSPCPSRWDSRDTSNASTAITIIVRIARL
ncbi:hypothetical protein PsYK624_168290 [Phanerochaete sordida]|uniref:Uncharacterized protein n=1 Tax=Phanerochaete sordida TaxID=48140 RepID=A0A9P3GRI8_9APHY|nr:hypothetical protein PsYK624_168290 [Phanerochaete sordida]